MSSSQLIKTIHRTVRTGIRPAPMGDRSSAQTLRRGDALGLDENQTKT
jgi:hypothetical protein